MNIKKRLAGAVVVIALLLTGGVNAAAAVEDNSATSSKNKIVALEFMQELNELRAGERPALTNEQIVSVYNEDNKDNSGFSPISVDSLQPNYASGNPVPALKVNSDLTEWAQKRADELAQLGKLDGHVGQDNGAPSWGPDSLFQSPAWRTCPAVSTTGCLVFGPEALAIGDNPIEAWASELYALDNTNNQRQGYGHYLTEISPLANIAGIGVAQITSGTYSGATVTVLKIGYDVGEGKTQTVEEALAELAPQPEPVTPVSVAETTVTVKEGQSPSLPAAVKVTYSDKTTKDVAVTWGQHDWSNQKPGTVTLSGSLEGIEPTVLKAKATITVTAKTATNATLNKAKLTVKSTNTGDITDDLKTITATVTYDNGTKAENQAVAWNALTDDQLATIRSRAGGQFVLEGTVAGRPVGLQITVSPASITSAKAKRDPFTTPVGIPLTQDDLNPVTVTWSNGDTTEEDYSWDLSDIDFSKPTAGTLKLVGHKDSNVVTSSIQVTDAVFDHLKTENLGTVEIPVTVDPTDKLNALKATLVYSDGSERSVDVTWEPIDPANYASDKAGSTFEVKGTVSVDGQDLPVSATVAVQARMITNIQLSQHELTIESGEDPAGKLAAITATIAYDNGESEVVSVDWPKISEDVYGAREGGEEIIGGYVNGVYEMQLTLRIKPATLTSVETALSDITVTEGTDPELPQTVDVEYSNGDQDVLAVTWSTDNADFSKVGDYPLSGTIAGWPEPATLTVHVVRASVVDVTVPEAVTVASGITEDKVMQLLPVTVIATMSNNTTVDVPVAWNALSADQKAMLQSREGGEFTLTGAVQGSDKTVSIKVTVQPAVATAAGFGEDGVDTAQVTMESGADAAALGLPKSATVRWSNGDETDEAVEWSELSAEQLSILSARRGGSFGIQGTVAGLVVHAVVTVNHAEAEKIVDSVDFKNGVATVSTDPTVLPQLPQSADVRWSNGDVTTEKVIWNTVDASQVADEGTTFEVNGSVSIEMEVLTDSITKDGSLTPGLELDTYTATLPVTAKVMVNNVTEQLEDAVADAGELNPDDYMADSWKVVAEAIERANGVLNAEDASIADKIAARDRLTAALGQLQSKRPTTSDGDSQQSSSERDAGQKHSQGNDQTSKVPNTGSAVVWIAVAAVVLLAVAGVIAVVMRRRKD